MWHGGARNISLVMLVHELRSALRDCQTILDIGCGTHSPARFLRAGYLVGVDGYPPALEEARNLRTHNEYCLGDVKQLRGLVPNRRFDACIALDVIEHLRPEEGWALLKDMEHLATKRVIIVTPNGFIPQKSQDGDLQEHLSGWTAEELRAAGYKIFGMYGPKSLRGEYHRIKYHPRPFWVLVSLLSHFLRTRSRPEKAAAIFCVKEKG